MKQKYFSLIFIGLIFLIGLLQAQQQQLQREIKPKLLETQNNGDDDEKENKKKENFIIDLQGDYTVGSECYSSSCPQTFYFSPVNTFRCPKAGSEYGGIFWESKQDQFFLWFSTFVPWRWHGQFYAPFGIENVFTNKYGHYEINIELEVGYFIRISPCNVKSHRGSQDYCDYRNRNHQLQIIKHFPEGDALYQWCSFTMTKNK